MVMQRQRERGTETVCGRLHFRLALPFILCVATFVAGCSGRTTSGDDLSADGTDGESGQASLDASTDSHTRPSPGSSLDATLADVAQPPADAISTACARTTCPAGCCDSSGQCQPGIAPNACGAAGEACQDCLATGFLSCDPAQKSCSGNTVPCGPANCAGCCVGARCLSGKDASSCGQRGSQCFDCTTAGAVCTSSDAGTVGACGPAAPTPCTFFTCRNGCCDASGICQSGTSSDACGTGGIACRKCASGQGCSAQQYCACIPQSCPSGCCDVATSTCRAGDSDTACGGGGLGCVNCLIVRSATPSSCSNRQCVAAPACTCTSGCCDMAGACHPGASNTQCGQGGIYCEDCTLSNMQCVSEQCATTDAGVCNAETCPTGCCDQSGQCQQGLASTSCGGFGTSCQTCLPFGQICSNQQCVAPPEGGPPCDPNTCEGCCDASGNCSFANTDTQCGFGGRRCADCSNLGGRCLTVGASPMGAYGMCDFPDGGFLCSQDCDGCCDASGKCQPGFTDTQCGQSGSACRNCTALSPPSTCDVNVAQRTCTSQQMQCPAPYPSCPAALQERAPPRQKVCSAAELQNAAAACGGGFDSAACGTFTTFEYNSNLACSVCLQNFEYDFATQVGIRSCVAPYLDATCNHNNACIDDCVTQSCYNCADLASTITCDTAVQTGVCSAYFQADACVTQALDGAGAVCNPATYQGNFGAWLQAVGTLYCGP